MPRTRKTTAGPSRLAPSELSAQERAAILNKRVAAETREFAALVRSRTEFEAVLVRGRRVSHRLHLVGLVTATAVAVAVSMWFSALDLPAVAPWLTPLVWVLPVGYGVSWMFLILTGGEQLELLSVDGEGRITSTRTGHGDAWQSDVLKVALPVAVIVVAGWITFGLVHDIVLPPDPHCQYPAVKDNDFCRYIVGMGRGTALTLVQARLVEQAIRSGQLIFSGGFLLGALWFLRRMLTGRWVVDARPVRRRADDRR